MADQENTPQGDVADSGSRLAELQAMCFGTDALPLAHFRGMDDAAIRGHYGIGPKTCEQIKGFLAELEILAPAAEPESAPEPAAPAAAVADGADEAQRESGGLGLLLTLVTVLLIIVLAVVFATRHGGGGAALAEAQQQVSVLTGALDVVKKGGASAAEAQARKVADSAHVGNFGDALSQLDEVERSLVTIELATRRAGGEDESGLAAAPLAATKNALGAARVALTLEKPATKEEVEAACRKLCETLGALSPKDETTHGEAGQQGDH